MRQFLKQLFRPAERREDGRLKTWDENSEEGKAASRLRLKVIGIMFLIAVLTILVVREIERLP